MPRNRCPVGRLTVMVLAIAVCLIATQIHAGEGQQRLLILPIELETDRGADNGDATFLRLMPAYNWGVNEDWQIVNLDLVLLADAPGGVPGRPGNPEPIPGDQETGLSDWIHASFFNPITDSPLLVGAGFLISVPTATDPSLGSGKWAAGPALRFTWRAGGWTIGAFGGQRWSFAGDADRADISQLMIRATIRKTLGERWFFVSAPIITANWNADRDDRWILPLGGGLGRKFRLGGNDWALSLQLYGNVLKPEGAPDWSARLGLTAVIPF